MILARKTQENQISLPSLPSLLNALAAGHGEEIRSLYSPSS